MRIARIVAFAFAFLCLGLGAVSLLFPTTMSFTAGANHHEWSCGSPAFPKDLADFGPEGIEDATNCAGGTGAAPALYALVLAGIGLAVATFTTWRIEATSRSVAASPLPEDESRPGA